MAGRPKWFGDSFGVPKKLSWHVIGILGIVICHEVQILCISVFIRHEVQILRVLSFVLAGSLSGRIRS